MRDMLQKCLSPTTLNGLELSNRLIGAATFEGMTPKGVPNQKLIDYHGRLAQGGLGMNTVAYCASEADGRVMEEMMYMHEAIRPQLQQLADSIHAQGGKLSGQLSHCGHFTQNRDFRGKQPLGPTSAFNISGLPYGLYHAGAMTHKDIRHLVQSFYNAAEFMKSVGFDAIEIHFGHGYGLSQFISPKTNKRRDQFGGPIENRMRIPLRVLEAVRTAVGDDFPILGKMGLTDGVEGGLEIDEALKVASMLDQAGIDCLIPSGGTSSMNPMMLFRGENVWNSLLAAEKNPVLALGIFVMRPFMFHNYPYEEMYFLDGAKRVRDTVKNAKICYVGGASTVDSIETLMKEFDFIQLGRAIIADPDMVNNLKKNPSYQNPCTHCNKCAALIKDPNGIRCVERYPMSA